MTKSAQVNRQQSPATWGEHTILPCCACHGVGNIPVFRQEMCKGTVSDKDNLRRQHFTPRPRQFYPSAHLLLRALNQPPSKIGCTFQDRLPLVRPVPFLEAVLVKETSCSHCQASATYFTIPPRHNKRRIDLANVKGQLSLCKGFCEYWLHIVCTVGESNVASNVADFLQRWQQHKRNLFARQGRSQAQRCRLNGPPQR